MPWIWTYVGTNYKILRNKKGEWLCPICKKNLESIESVSSPVLLGCKKHHLFEHNLKTKLTRIENGSDYGY